MGQMDVRQGITEGEHNMIWAAGVGGMAGAMLRYTLGKIITRKAAAAGSSFPWGTWVINISGSLLLGILYVLTVEGLLPPLWWAVLGIGFCGAYTTFSTFGYETMQLIGAHKRMQAVLYVMSSVIVGIAAAFAGMWLTTFIVN